MTIADRSVRLKIMRSSEKYGMLRIRKEDLDTLKIIRAEAMIRLQQPIKNIDFMSTIFKLGIKALRKEQFQSLTKSYFISPTYKSRKDVQGYK